MSSKKSSKATNDVESFLQGLDDLVPKSGSSGETQTSSGSGDQSKETTSSNTDSQSAAATSGPSSHSAAEAQSLLDDLDSLVQQRRSTSTPRLTATVQPKAQNQPSAARTTITSSAASIASQAQSPSQPQSQPQSQQKSESTATTSSGWGAWGGSVWSSATKLADQAKVELERRAQEAAVAYDQLQKSQTQRYSDSERSTKSSSGYGPDGGSGSNASTSTPDVPITDPTLPITNATPQEQERARETAEILRKEISRRGWAFAQGLRGLVAEGGLEKLGSNLTTTTRKGLTDLLNAVAPPISSHEVLQVTLSHDLVGYDGISEVVFRVLTSVMESHHNNLRGEGAGFGTDQQLVVNKAPNGKGGRVGERPKDDEGEERNLNAVEGFEAAKKLTEAELDSLIKSHSSSHSFNDPNTSSTSLQPVSSLTIPVKNCPIFVRIQPVISAFPWSGLSSATEGQSKERKEDQERGNIFVIIALRDPENGLNHETLSQAIPKSWMDIPFEENVWVEQALVDVLQGALSVVGQDYVNGRMSGRSRSTTMKLPGSLTSSGQPEDIEDKAGSS